MKTIALSAAFALSLPFNALVAQESPKPDIRTLFGGSQELDNGGWGGPSIHFTQVMGKDALLVGARGGWLIDHGFTLGLAGQGMVTDVANTDYDGYRLSIGDSIRQPSQFRMGYGGLLLEPIIAPSSPIHVSLPIIIGAGGCGYQTYGPQRVDFDPIHSREDFQAFFVVDAGMEVEFNLIKLVRLGVGASYRYTTDITLPETPKDALRGFNAGLTIKVGRF